jgi:FkbM family methyltransferase
MIKLAIDEVMPAAMFLERQERYIDAITLLCHFYVEMKEPLFLHEAAGIQVLLNRQDIAREYLTTLTLNHGFKPSEKFLAVLNYLHTEGNVTTILDGGIEFRLPVTGHSWEIEYEWINGRFFEPMELEYLIEHIPPNSIFLDIGANVGNHTVYIARHRPDIQVMVIEAEPRASAILKQNINMNKVLNIDTSRLGYAISGNEDPVFLQFRNSSSSTRRSPDKSGIECPSITLNQLLEPTTQFIKMDIEGMEKEVLQPALNKLFEFRVSAMLEVLNPNKDEYDAFFSQSGLTIIDRIPMHAGENIVVAAY